MWFQSDNLDFHLDASNVRYQSKIEITTAPTLFFFTAARTPMARTREGLPLRNFNRTTLAGG